MSAPRTQHPNAVTAGGTTGLAAVVVWIASLCGLTLSAYAGLSIAGALTVAVLAFARYGLLGVWSRFLRGDQPAKP